MTLWWANPLSKESNCLGIISPWYWALLDQLCSFWRTSRILRNLEVHYHAHRNPPLVPIPNQINQIHTTTSYLSKITVKFSLPLCPGGTAPWHLLERRPGESQSWSGWYGEMKILDPTRTRNSYPLVVQPVATCCTDCYHGSPSSKIHFHIFHPSVSWFS
jgi:hypothetical protein